MRPGRPSPKISARCSSASLHSIETGQKWLRELQLAIRGGKTQQGRFDVAASVLRTAERVRSEAEGEISLEVLMPPNLPRVAGAAVVFERALLQLVRRRLAESVPGRPITLLARGLGGEPARGVIVSVTDFPDVHRRDNSGHPPEAVQQAILTMGGEIASVEDSLLGRVTSLRLGASSH